MVSAYDSSEVVAFSDDGAPEPVAMVRGSSGGWCTGARGHGEADLDRGVRGSRWGVVAVRRAQQARQRALA
ncbi:hypothetical protein GCM10023200_13260 [Actinomycetospora chlora]|uniref:Uncharacterized protein n=1 Tax=Actinomycetospora chlora TaxID=663608 RepID=A0ABP9AHW3_9PSEU